jgi:hypothetical protein
MRARVLLIPLHLLKLISTTTLNPGRPFNNKNPILMTDRVFVFVHITLVIKYATGSHSGVAQNSGV